MNNRFSRIRQYNIDRLDQIFDEEYQVCIKPVLPNEKKHMRFKVGQTGVLIKKNRKIGKLEKEVFLHPANVNLCYIKGGFSLNLDILSIFGKKYGVVDMLAPQCYYHWVANDFPRILLCYQAGFRDIIILDQGKIDIRKLKKFQKEFIDLLPGLRLHYLNKSVKTRSICIPILPDEYGGEDKFVDGVHLYDYYTHRITRYVTREIPRLFDLKDKNVKRRLKIQRRGENCRDPKNIVDFNNFLQKKWGFEIVYLEDYTIKEQMQMMRDSEIVIGAHGSGLVNFISARKNSILMEYGNTDYYESTPNYEKKSRTKTKSFFHFMCEVSDKEFIFIPVKNDVIDVNHVDFLLKKVVGLVIS